MRALSALVFTGCWTTSQPTEPVKSVPAPIEIAIASVRLADDCPDGVAAGKVEEASSKGDCADDCNFARACEQTQLQISLRSSATEAVAFTVKRVEILDANGKTISTLTARNPTRWAEAGKYTKWNQIVGPNELLAASYSLTAPNWSVLPSGRDPAVTYKVRVTFAVGGGERTVEKQAIVSAFSEPNVVT